MRPAPPRRRSRSLAGFTLIELLIVILIIGVLVAIAVPAYLRYTASANDRDAQAALQTAYKAAVAGDTEMNAGRFPVATSVVADVKQDEPAASVTRGDCIGGVATAPVKQVLVDPASTSSQITLCTRSASGAVWKLSGPLTGNPIIVDGSAVVLTFGGANEITDASRALGQQGDGLTNDSSTGLWESTTNLIKNGGCEGGTSNMGPWGGTNNETRTKDTSQHKFGLASCAIGTDGAVADQGISWHDDANSSGGGRIAVSASMPYVFSVWVRGSVGGETVKIGLNSYDSGGSIISGGGGGTYTLTTSWQRIALATTTPSNAATAFAWLATTTAQADTFYVDGAQLEQKQEPTPYVETNGTTASRGLAQVQAPAALLTATQGWVALRARLGFSNTDQMNPTSMAFFNIGSNNSNEILGFWDPVNRDWSLARDQGTTASPGRPTVSDTFMPGALRTLIFRWTATSLAVSLNGAPFVSNNGTNTALPVLDTNLYIGARSWGGNDQQPDSSILWLATGTGTLSDVDAAMIASWGSNDPKRSSFPATAQATMSWDCATSSGSLK